MNTAELRRRGIKVTEISQWGPYMRKLWENTFVSHLSAAEKKAIYLFDKDGACRYLWHVFSFKKKSCLCGEEAAITFDAQNKLYCYLFYQHSDRALILENANALKAADLLGAVNPFTFDTDIYVTDREFTWTFVQTHESQWCGPFFSRVGM